MPKEKKIAKIMVDREKCIGAAPCITLAPGTFELDEEGIAVVKDTITDSQEDILAAAAACPVDAILLYDEQGNRIFPKKK